MLARLTGFWHRLGRKLSRTEWLIRLLRLTRADEQEEAPPGLVMVQIDGLSRRQFERALHHGRMPFLKQLLRREGYRLHTHYSGLPSSTPAVQGELFYGRRCAVPAFSYHDERLGRVVRMFEADATATVEEQLEQEGEALLAGGSAYMDIYTGGAATPHFCASTLQLSRMVERPGSSAFLLALLLNPISVLRVTAVFGLEVVLALIDCVRGIIAGRDLWKELKFVPLRVGVCILARELIAIGAMVDVTRGLPIVHLNLLGYDEQAHRRGPSSNFAHWTLGGIDNTIERIWGKARQATGRDYALWVYSDHGQEDVVPYPRITGRSVQTAVQQVYDETLEADEGGVPEARGIQNQRAHTLRQGKQTPRAQRATPGEATRPIVTAMGPLGHVYWPRALPAEERRAVAARLVAEAQIPLVLFTGEAGQVRACSPAGEFELPGEAAGVLGEQHPHLHEAARDLVGVCRHARAGTFVISGFRKHDWTITFPRESGSHAGPGSEETTGFALLPRDARVEPRADGSLRPMKLREGVQRHLWRRPAAVARRPVAATQQLRLLTYNVHYCIGMDGRLAPRRIARVIEQTDADIVAMQELDQYRARTGGVEQARLISDMLQMDYHFHPSVEVAGEHFGNAVLSRLPMRVVKAAALPGLRSNRRREPRAALWVQIDVNGTPVHVLNTHFGLNRAERMLQAQAILSEAWCGHADCGGPVVLCGDLNALPGSRVCQMIGEQLQHAQRLRGGRRPRATWPARWPVGCIDHVFASDELAVRDVRVLDDGLARVASDHRPVLVTLEVPATPGRANHAVG